MKKGNLIKLAKENGFELFHIPASVGGRFSELCPVGLLPAAVCGIDIREMLAARRAMDDAAVRTTYGRIPRCWKRCCSISPCGDGTTYRCQP